MSDKFIIYTDGSCLKNPSGPGSWAVVIFKDKDPVFISGFSRSTTNQRMEMMAVIQALEYLPDDSHVKLCTDSAYVYNCIQQKWYSRWMVNNWKNAKGENVANRDLWERMLSNINRIKNIEMIKVKGHSDNIFNNKCDEMAREISDFAIKVRSMVE